VSVTIPPPLAPATPARRRRRLNGSVVVGGALVGAVVAAALISYVWTPHEPGRLIPGDRLSRVMENGHVLGADNLGRDVLTELMVGARLTLYVGVVAVAIAAVIGIPLGALAAVRGGWISELIMRASDLVLAFPAVLLAIMLAATVKNPDSRTFTAMVAIGVGSVPAFARLTRAEAMRVLSTEYVMAARASGRSRLAIVTRHVLPNVAAALIVQASVLFAIAILAEAALSYLGIGAGPDVTSWGRMLDDSQTYVRQRLTLAVFPGMAIALAVLGFNLLGDGLRDTLDPTLRRRSR
jgi:peptide/nickel transport system permease protein